MSIRFCENKLIPNAVYFNDNGEGTIIGYKDPEMTKPMYEEDIVSLEDKYSIVLVSNNSIFRVLNTYNEYIAIPGSSKGYAGIGLVYIADAYGSEIKTVSLMEKAYFEKDNEGPAEDTDDGMPPYEEGVFEGGELNGPGGEYQS